MVYKKYIEKDGKTYGPYYYESYREGGKVKKRYVKAPLDLSSFQNSNKVNNFPMPQSRVNLFLILGIILIAGIVFFLLLQGQTTGRAVLDIQTTYQYGEPLKGNFLFTLQQGELIPKDSFLKIKLGSEEHNQALSELVNYETISGDFYASNTDISGSGEGFGIAGNKSTFPEVDFKLKLLDEKKEKDETGGNGSVNTEPIVQPEQPIVEPQEPIVQPEQEQPAVQPEQPIIQPEQPKEQKQEKSEKSSEPAAASQGIESASNNLITGEAISENSKEKIITGKVKKGEDFIYEIEAGKSAEIVPNSVEVNGKKIDESKIKIAVDNGKVIVSSDYEFFESGFGKDFLGDEKLTLSVDISSLDLNATGDKLSVSLDYNNISIVSVEKSLSVEGLNQSAEEINQSIKNETEILADNETEILLVNETSNLTIKLINAIPTIRLNQNNSAELTLSDYFSGAERYSFNEVDNITSSISDGILTLTVQDGFKGVIKGKVTAYAGNESLESNEFNILVSSGKIQIITSRNKIEVGKPVKWIKNISLQESGNFTIDLPREAENISLKKIEENKEQKINPLTGKVISNNDGKKKSIFSRIAQFFRFSGYAAGSSDNALPADNSTKSVEILSEQNVSNYVVEYTTPAPQSFEEIKSNGKIVRIEGSDSLNYTDIIASTNLSNRVAIANSASLKIYWYNYGYGNESLELKKASEVENQSIIDVSGEISLDNNENISINNENNSDNVIIAGNSSASENNTDNITSDSSSLISGKMTAQIDEEKLSNKQVNITANEFSEEISKDNQTAIESNETEGNETIYSNIITDSDGNKYRREAVPFDAYDLDSDGKIDYIEWVVPHLSSQTFEIIEISKAEHLDENRTFVEDVYDSVKAKDSNWTTIPEGQYLRVQFEQNLTNKNDITIYAKVSCANNSTIAVDGIEVPCEIYQKKLRLDALRGEVQNG